MTLPTTVVLIAPGIDSNNNLFYDYKDTFNLLNNFLDSHFSIDSRFLLITSENFLAKQSRITSPNSIAALSEEELARAIEEFMKCSRSYPKSTFIANSFSQTIGGDSSPSWNSLYNWSRIADKNLYPYFNYTSTSIEAPSIKAEKIRNSANNFPYVNSTGYYCNFTSNFHGPEDGIATLKGMYLGNYENIACDALNLNLSNKNYYNNTCIENLGPYYVNGYPTPLINFQSLQYFLMIGQDALNLWDLYKVKEYNASDLSTKPLIIQCDQMSYAPSSISSDNSIVTPSSFFNSLFPNSVTPSNPGSYPSYFTIEDKTTNIAPKKTLLEFLSKVPYIVFADTKGYITSNNTSTVGGVYTYTGKDTKNNSIFTLAEKYFSSQGYLDGSSNSKAPRYTIYNLTPPPYSSN